MDAIPISHIEIVDGQAVIKGRRVKAKMVASMHINAGAPIEEVMEQYDLSRAEVYAALAYYYDNREAIEEGFRQAETYLEQVGGSIDDLIARLRARKSTSSDE